MCARVTTDVALQALKERDFVAKGAVGPKKVRPSACCEKAGKRSCGVERRGRRRRMDLGQIMMTEAVRMVQEGELDGKDEEEENMVTRNSDEVYRNTALNALPNLGKGATPVQVARRIAAIKEREKATIFHTKLQRAVDIVMKRMGLA